MNSKYVYQHCDLQEEVAILQADHDPLRAMAMDVSLDVSDSSMRMRSYEPVDRGAQIKVGFNFLKPDRTEDFVQVDAEVFDRFQEPENETWQIGVRLHFADPVQEQHVLTKLSSCEGFF